MNNDTCLSRSLPLPGLIETDEFIWALNKRMNGMRHFQQHYSKYSVELSLNDDVSLGFALAK